MPRHQHRDANGRFCKAPAAAQPAAAPAPTLSPLRISARGGAQRWLRPVLALGIALACVVGVPPARPVMAWSPQAVVPVSIASPTAALPAAPGSCARLVGQGPHAWQVEAARLTAAGSRVTVPALRLACAN